MLTGRRTFDVAGGWGGNHAWGPAFVLAHEIPAGWPRADSTVTFVTDGIESAVTQAKAAAGGKAVGVHGADTIQQLLNAGLLDEISVDIAAVLLGSGVRLFDHLDGTPAVLGNPSVDPGRRGHAPAIPHPHPMNGAASFRRGPGGLFEAPEIGTDNSGPWTRATSRGVKVTPSDRDVTVASSRLERSLHV